MPEIDPSAIHAATWAAAALSALAILAALIRRKWRREDDETRRRRENYNAYVSALHEWQDAIDHGDAAAAAELAKEIRAMRGKGWDRP